MCEIVIVESKGYGRYHKPRVEDSPPPPKIMVLEIVPVPKGEKNAVELPTVKMPVVTTPVVKPPVVNPAAIKSSAVKLPIKLPTVNLAAVKMPVVKSTSSPPSTNGGGPRTAKSDNNKRNAPAIKHTHSPPHTTGRMKVRPEPTKPRVPKIVRFAFDKTRNTAMEKINQYAEGSSDDTEESFTDPPKPSYQREFDSYHEYRTLGPPERKSVRFAPSTKDNHRSSRSMAWNRFQADDKWSHNSSATLVDAGAPETRYQKANPTSKTAQHSQVGNDLTSQARHGNDRTIPSKPMYRRDSNSDMWDPNSKSVRFAPSIKDNHRSSHSMAWNRFQADDKWSHNSSATLVDAGAPETRYQKANPTSKTAQHSQVGYDLTSQARHGNDHTIPSKPMYLPDSDSDSWDSDSDLASYIDPGDCVVDRDYDGWGDDGWDNDGWGNDGWDMPRQPPAPIFVYRSTKQASSAESTSSKKPSSSGKKPVEPIMKHEPEPTPTKKKFLEPVFIYRNPGAPPGAEPVFVWRPSSDINKETKCTHGECPIDWERVISGAKKPRKHAPPATDNTRRSDKPHRRSSKPHSWRRHHYDDAEDLAAQFGRTGLGLSWRDV